MVLGTTAPSRSGGSYLPESLSSSSYLSVGLTDSSSRKKKEGSSHWCGGTGWPFRVLLVFGSFVYEILRCEPQGKRGLGEGKDLFKRPAGKETSSAHLSLDGISVLGEDLKYV